MSTLKIEDTSSCEISPSCKGYICIFVVDNFGNTQPQTTAKVRCWLRRGEKADETLMVLGKFPTDLLGLDLLKGRFWTDEEGKIMGFWEGNPPSVFITFCPCSSPLLSNQCQTLSLTLGSQWRNHPSYGRFERKRHNDCNAFSLQSSCLTSSQAK